MSEREGMFVPKNESRSLSSEEVSRLQREAEQIDKMIEEKIVELEKDPEQLRGFMREHVMPLIQQLNMEFVFAKAYGDQNVIDAHANSEFQFRNLMSNLEYRVGNKQE